jgi:hypothetical protein
MKCILLADYEGSFEKTEMETCIASEQYKYSTYYWK